jgi:hypothetical protein
MRSIGTDSDSRAQGGTICRGEGPFPGPAERLRSKTALVLLFAPGDDREGVIGQGALQLERFIGGGRQPGVDLFPSRQYDGHSLRVNRADDLVGIGSQESKEVVGRLAFLDLSHRGPVCADAREAGERTRLVERKPDGRPGM